MNRVEIIGRLGKDAEVGESGSGNTVINFNVAASEKWTNKQGEKQEKTTWYRCAWWLNNTSILQYLTKGTQVYVEGTPECRAYINKEGEAVAVMGVKVFKIELLGGGADPGAKPQSKQDYKAPEPENFDPHDDDLPFN